jgi:hypothetical protein
MSLSQKGFCQGERGAVTTSSMPEAGRAAPHLRAVDAVPVADQGKRCRLEGESLPQLPGDPRRRRCRRDVEVKDTAAVVAEDLKNVQQAKGYGGHDEEVHRGQHPSVDA